MVSLIDLDNPALSYSGQIFWDMLRPGVRLAVCGPRGCTTSTIRRVIATRRDQYFIETRNTRYVLTAGREASRSELKQTLDMMAA